MKDIVLDSCVMRLYDTPSDPRFKDLFRWLYEGGTLFVSLAMVHEYNRHGNPLVASLLDYLGKQNRLKKISSRYLDGFPHDGKFRYRCNQEDIPHARLTFVTPRKKLVSFDDALRSDVNSFPAIKGVKPRAEKHPTKGFFV